MEEKHAGQMIVLESGESEMETDQDGVGTTVIFNQMVIQRGQQSTELDVTPARYEREDGHDYSASVKQILVEFRRHAHSLMGAQIQLHNRQDINQDQVM